MKHNLSENNLRLFEQYLILNEKSPNTISYIQWFQDRFQRIPQQLFMENIAKLKKRELIQKGLADHNARFVLEKIEK